MISSRIIEILSGEITYANQQISECGLLGFATLRERSALGIADVVLEGLENSLGLAD